MCVDLTHIRCVDTRYPGASHDSHIWNLSNARRYFQSKYQKGDRNTWILGDAGYPLEPWIMTPYRCAEAGSAKSTYNSRHSKTRNVVERTIGVLKNRFRCILGARQLHYSPQKAAQIINVACALHNICIHYRVLDNTNIPHFDIEDQEGSQENIGIDDSSSYQNVANAMRNNIRNTFV
ncbi:putative nuclease HARBI1 [Eupeodes corollae]|uniref:putative nuclease HARBI1 n=1 Tax=Eupeodes corollae TaxID=290404 RepID=UPI002492C51A|nr:putative nuclease HARBI1 [Eupeodes corollae]